MTYTIIIALPVHIIASSLTGFEPDNSLRVLSVTDHVTDGDLEWDSDVQVVIVIVIVTT